VVAALLVFASASTGFPPLAIVAVLVGQLRMSLTLFFVIGLVGRWLRFAAVLGGAGWLSQLFR
jgi:membrane protein YqaA with SNARE-associated domain